MSECPALTAIRESMLRVIWLDVATVHHNFHTILTFSTLRYILYLNSLSFMILFRLVLLIETKYPSTQFLMLVEPHFTGTGHSVLKVVADFFCSYSLKSDELKLFSHLSCSHALKSLDYPVLITNVYPVPTNPVLGSNSDIMIRISGSDSKSKTGTRFPVALTSSFLILSSFATS